MKRLEQTGEFAFCAVMPRVAKKLGPKALLEKRIADLKKSGMTHREIAALISAHMDKRTVEGWSNGKSLPRDWSSDLILQKLAAIDFREGSR